MSNILFIIAAMVFIPWLLLKLTNCEKFVPLPMAQIAFGICFGPSALGSLFPEIWSNIFTDPIRMGLDAVQILAISIFAFIVGIELKPKEVIEREGNAIWVQAFQVVFIPIILAGICFILFFNNPIWHNPDIPFWKYAWAMGVATCITAMPMLVVACKSLGIWGTHTSKKLLGLVTFDDMVLWFTVALFVSLGKYAVNSIIFFLIFAVLYFIWPKLLDKCDEKTYPSLVVTFALCMAGFSYWAGLHYVIGAFFAGMITPKKAILWNQGMETQQMYWLMPVFFIWTGLKIQWNLDFHIILQASLLMLVIAIVTKFVGVYLAYRKQGMRIVLFYTSLLQNKGLMEIFLVTMLFGVGIISQNTFAAVVIMSLISTVLAVPLARLFYDPKLDGES